MSQLARLVGVEQRTISGYESAEYLPPDDRLEAIATCLKFPLAFFFEETVPVIEPDTASFRSMTKMSAAKRDIALMSGGLALILNEFIEGSFQLPSPDFPDLSREGDSEAAADSLRRHWGIGEMPIKQMIHLLESRGARVYSLAIAAQEVDAFSMWKDHLPFVFLNTQKSSERSRFDCAHELAHLVLHRHGEQKIDGSQIIEKEANNFAGAFLMPRSSILAYTPKSLLTLETLVELKKVWGVSVAALTYRLRQLNILTEWHYRELNIQIAKRGYRTKEPTSIQRESSQILSKVLSAFRSEGLNRHKLAEKLNFSVQDIDDLSFGLTLTPVFGNLDKPKEISTARLKLVK